MPGRGPEDAAASLSSHSLTLSAPSATCVLTQDLGPDLWSPGKALSPSSCRSERASVSAVPPSCSRHALNASLRAFVRICKKSFTK